MSEPKDTNWSVTIDADGCHVHMDDFLNADEVSADVEYVPRRRSSTGSGAILPAAVRLEIGVARLVLTPAAWRSVIYALQQVLPAEVGA